MQIVFEVVGSVFFDRRRQCGNALAQIALLAHLRDGPIQVAVSSRRQRLRIIEEHLASIRVFVRFTPLREGREQVTLGLAPLDVMVRHYNVHYVVRSPLRHMATDAIARLRMCARSSHLANLGFVALPADFSVALCRLLSPWNVVGIVTCCASQLTFAFLKTSG